MSVRGIVLFLFGGVSQIGGEAESARNEFVMALVGPLTSLVLAGLFGLLRQIWLGQNSPVEALLTYLALVNVLLAGFNLLPGFPLDGGRVLRSILWGTTGNLVRATTISATVGQAFGWLFIALGVFQLLQGNFLGGLWIAFIGWFLNGAAESSRGELTLQEHFRNVKIVDVMDKSPQTVTPQTTVEELVHTAFLQSGRPAALVCQDDQLVGIVTLVDVKKLSRERWPETTVVEIMTRQPLYSVTRTDDLNAALSLMAEHDINQVPVLVDGRLAGLLTRAQIVRHVQMSQALGLGR
jgi:CBS domain-containing protein